MREIYSEVEIKATPERVWDVITDFDSFPDWNPFLRRVDGELKAGGQIEIEVRAGSGRSSKMQPTVVKSERPSEIRWNVRQSFGLFNREHVINIRSIGEERAQVIQRGLFSGILVPFMGSAIDETREGCVAMNEALRARVERAQD